MTTAVASSFPTSSLPQHLQQLSRLPPDVTRILYIKSLPFTISADDLYDIFGRYGAIRQIRLGSTSTTRGKAFVVYEDIFDAQRAVTHLNGFNVMGRYLVVLYWKGDRDREKGAGLAAAAAGCEWWGEGGAGEEEAEDIETYEDRPLEWTQSARKHRTNLSTMRHSIDCAASRIRVGQQFGLQLGGYGCVVCECHGVAAGATCAAAQSIGIIQQLYQWHVTPHLLSPTTRTLHSQYDTTPPAGHIVHHRAHVSFVHCDVHGHERLQQTDAAGRVL